MQHIAVKEAATYVGLSKSNLDKLRCYGGGPIYFKVGRRVVYATADLDVWLAARRRTSTWGDNDNAALPRSSVAA